MDERLRRLIVRMLARISGAMDALQAGSVTPAQWADTFARHLAAGHADALRAGGVDPRSERGRDVLTRTVATQLHFLRGFQAVIESAPAFEAGWKARAAMYANSVGEPYWRGRVKLLPLPAVPKDGSTLCKNNCRCTLDVQWIDEANGDADVYWRMSDAEHCGTCVARAQVWAPLRIRGGELQSVTHG